MLAIKSIEVVEVERDRLEVADWQGIKDVRVYDTNGTPSKMDVAHAFETIEGRIFVNSNGLELCIGMSKQVQDAIGLPFKAFEDAEKVLNRRWDDIMDLKRINEDQQKKLEVVKDANFWKRFKYAITGKMQTG